MALQQTPTQEERYVGIGEGVGGGRGVIKITRAILKDRIGYLANDNMV